MKYLLTIYADESIYATQTPEEGAAEMQAYEEFGAAAAEAGVLLGGEGLQPTSTATVVKVREGERLLTDGPFAEAREQLGGYYLIDAPSLDEALDWAARIPAATHGSVEVRPVMDYEAMAAGAPASAEQSA